MDLLGAFTLFQAASISVRVEPPDAVIIEEPGRPARRFAREQLVRCTPMLVRVYRERHPGTLPGADEGEIVIELQLADAPLALLGPYPWKDGIGAGYAVEHGAAELLFAAPRLSLVASGDGRSIRFTTGNMMVPIPAATLVGAERRAAAAKHTLATGLEGDHAVLFVMRDGKPWLIGPWSADDAALVVRAVQTWRASHPLDDVPQDVTEAQLEAEPVRWHGRRIRVEGTWFFGFENSRFAGAWFSPPRDQRPERGTYRVRAVGTWFYPRAGADGGYGHMGLWPGELQAESVELL